MLTFSEISQIQSILFSLSKIFGLRKFRKIKKENPFDALEKTAIALSGIEEIGKFCTKIDVYSKNVFGEITSIEALI